MIYAARVYGCQGTPNDYRKGCRCDDCRSAMSHYRRVGRLKRKPRIPRSVLYQVVRNACASTSDTTRAVVVAALREHVSLPTADRVIRELAEMGVLHRRQGFYWIEEKT